MGNFWLYVGIFMICSGLGTPVGILILVFYFWDDIKKTIHNNPRYTENHFHLSENNANNADDSGYKINHGPKKHYDSDTLDEMK